MNTKKRILIFAHGLNITGVSSSLVSMLKELNYMKYSVDLCLLQHIGPWMKEIPVEVNLLPEVQVNTRWNRLIFFLWYWIAGIYYRVFRRSHIDFIGGTQIRYALDSLLGVYPKKLSNQEYDECWIYGGNPAMAERVNAKVRKAWVHEDWGVWKVVPFLARKQFRKIDVAINVSPIAKDHFDQLKLLCHGAQSVLLENVLSKKWLMERAEAYTVPSFDGLKITTVGRASAAKNFMRAVETAKLLKEKNVSFKWFIVGEGEELELLREKVKGLDLEGYVSLPGGTDNPSPYYKWCDLYVCTSDTEAKSVTICEAQAFNKPVIMTNFPTAPNHIVDVTRDVVVDSTAEALSMEIMGRLK